VRRRERVADIEDADRHTVSSACSGCD